MKVLFITVGPVANGHFLGEWRRYLLVDETIEYAVADVATVTGVLQAMQFTGKVIALGYNADARLNILQIPHFSIPHPSKSNYLINTKPEVMGILNTCKRWLYNGGAA